MNTLTRQSLLVLSIYYYCVSLTYSHALPEITCNNSSKSCVISCAHNASCTNLDIISTQFLQQKQQYPFINNNLSSLTMECLEEESCNDIKINCHNFGVENCTVACLKDDSCTNITLLCGTRSSQNKLKQCFIYTIRSDSAVKYSSVNCNYSITNKNEMYCGYKCGLESDGCYEDNICIYNGYDTNCSCHGYQSACDQVTIISNIFTTPGPAGQDTSIFENLTDEILIYIAIGLGGTCILLFILICCYKIRKRNEIRDRNITQEYEIDNLKSGLLKHDTLTDKNNDNKSKNNQTKEIKTSYDDKAELGSFKLVPDAELGDTLFNDHIIDEKDDEFL